MKADDERQATATRLAAEREREAEQARVSAERNAVVDAKREVTRQREAARLSRQRQNEALTRKIQDAVATLQDGDIDALSRKYAQAVCDQYNIDASANIDEQVGRLGRDTKNSAP